MAHRSCSNASTSSQNETTNETPMESKKCKITVVGNSMVGKTLMLITYTTKEYFEEYIPPVFGDDFHTEITLEGVKYSAEIWVNSGKEFYEGMKRFTYPDTTCFLLCYSIDSKMSYDNIIFKWYPELKHYCPNVPIILVATKCDLRDTPKEEVTLKEGRRLARKIRAYTHMECSSREFKGLEEIIAEAVKCSISKINAKSKPCIIS